MITIAMLAALAMPPSPFDHTPAGRFKIINTDSILIYAACPVPDGWIVFGCVVGHKVYIRTDITAFARAKVLRHEFGHLNGWVHS